MSLVRRQILIDELDNCRAVEIRCLDTGSFCSPRLAGKRFYSRWLDESLGALRDTVCAGRPITGRSDA